MFHMSKRFFLKHKNSKMFSSFSAEYKTLQGGDILDYSLHLNSSKFLKINNNIFYSLYRLFSFNFQNIDSPVYGGYAAQAVRNSCLYWQFQAKLGRCQTDSKQWSDSLNAAPPSKVLTLSIRSSETLSVCL